jgi:luciferase family oxidoreductase group 1
MRIPVSILDQSPVVEGATPSDALAATVALAQRADELGIRRFWVAEHHSIPSYASSAPEVLVATLLAKTHDIRVGSGGVLLPRRDPEKVAESFRVLTGLYGPRVDLGIGRSRASAELFDRQIDELRRQLGMDGSGDEQVMPSGTPAPQMWLLGNSSTVVSAATRTGTAFCFGHFINPAGSVEVLRTYRHTYADRTHPSPPVCALAVNVIVADLDERARALADAYLLFRSRRDLGQDAVFPSAATVRGHRWTSAEQERAAVHRAALFAGTPDQLATQLGSLVTEHGVDELVVNTLTHEYDDRQRSYVLLADVLAERHAGEGLANRLSLT